MTKSLPFALLDFESTWIFFFFNFPKFIKRAALNYATGLFDMDFVLPDDKSVMLLSELPSLRFVALFWTSLNTGCEWVMGEETPRMSSEKEEKVDRGKEVRKAHY